MTFCLGMTVEQGLVGIADTRVVAGNECLVARKTASYQGPGFAFFVMSSGLRSLRDKILLYFEEAFARDTRARSPVQSGGPLHQTGAPRAGGRRRPAEARRPQLQRIRTHRRANGGRFGASGFGKPILERSVKHSDTMQYAFKVGLLAFDATRLCAADVDFPMDVILYLKDSFELVEHRYERDDLREISNWWQERMRRSVQELPTELVEHAFSRLTGDPVLR